MLCELNIALFPSEGVNSIEIGRSHLQPLFPLTVRIVRRPGDELNHWLCK